MIQRHPLGVNDITVLPPPGLTPQRALEFYQPAFMRVVEYITQCKIFGNILEFGTFHGYTARTLAECMNICKTPGDLYLFDSWEGFPEMTSHDEHCPEVEKKLWKKGDCEPAIMEAEKAIKYFLNILLPDRIYTVKGFYEETVPSKLPDGPAAIVHIDCDLYTSTHHVLKSLIEKGSLEQGTVILFDDWNNNYASDKFGERRATQELFILNPCEYYLEPWFVYGFSGKAFIVHKK